MLDKATREHAREKSDEEEEEHREELSHCLAQVLTVHLLTLLTSAVLLLPILLLLWSHVAAARLVAEKHEVEEFFRVDKVVNSIVVKVAAMEVMATSTSGARPTRLMSLERIRVPELVILAALGWIRQARHGCIDFLKSLIGIRRVILIGMHFQTLPLVCFL